MSKLLGDMPPLTALIEGVEMTSDIVARLVTIAYWQSHIASTELLDNIVPRLHPLKRGLPLRVAKRMEGDLVFEKAFLADLSNLIASLETEIEAGTHVSWHGDENHCRGGYQDVFREPGVADFQRAVNELEVLREAIVASICAARSFRDASKLMSF